MKNVLDQLIMLQLTVHAIIGKPLTSFHGDDEEYLKWIWYF